MNLMLRKNGGLPSLLSDFFGTSLIDKDFFDLDSDFFTFTSRYQWFQQETLQKLQRSINWNWLLRDFERQGF